MLEQSLETLPAKEPDIRKIATELDQAATDATDYLSRINRCRGWWHNTWKGQAWDGRKHAEGEQDITLPWEGASDSRLRIVSTLIREHVSLAKAAFWGARASVKSTRPLVYGRVGNIAQKVLEWHVYTQMRREVNTELWLAWNWKFALGLSFISVEWEQARTVSEEPIKVEDLIAISQQLGLPELSDLGGGEESDLEIVEFLQQLSPILDKDRAHAIVSDLRNEGESTLPVVNYVVNKPRWSALLPCVDIIFPSESWDIQRERFVNRRELVTESDLVDRIVTDDYDPDFVEEAVKHKGEFADWLVQPNRSYSAQGSERDMIELHHFLHRNVESGIPTIYKTIFSQSVVDKNLCAVHKVFEYSHQMYPLVTLRRAYDFRPLLSSMGIAEEAYTDEMDIKTQQDGLTDRTELINSPPMVVPMLRALGVRGQWGPRAIMPALRPGEVTWPPLPPSDQTPTLVIKMVQDRLDRRYSISGPTVDQQMKVIRQQELANDTHVEVELMLEQTLKLAQQFDTDEVVQRVAGKGDQPWNISTKDIQGDFEISVTMDMRQSDIAYVKDKLGLYQQALGMNQAGTAKMNKIFSRIMGIIDPDAEDLIEEDQQSASQKEIDEEDAAAVSILSGIEPRFPQFGNHKLRSQRLVSQTIQSKNPEVQQKIAASKTIQELLKSRLQNFQNQIQQHEINPQIGRSVTTSATNRQQPAELQTE